MAARIKPSPRIHSLDNLFGDNLLALRLGLKLTRNDLARRSGVPGYAIEAIETGRSPKRARRRATIGEAIALAEALGVKPGELLRGAA